LLTAMPVDGENCTAVTPERLLPAIERDTIVPCNPLVGFKDVMWGAGGRIEKASVLKFRPVTKRRH